MSFSKVLAAAALGLGALAVGCGPAEGSGGPEAFDFDDPLFSTMSEGGSGSGNGLTPADFHANKVLLAKATMARLAVYNAAQQKYYFDSANAPVTQLLSTAAGRRTLSYAVKCALTGAPIWSGTTAYVPKSLVAATQDWRDDGLSAGRAGLLFSCMLAHLNAFGVEVSINLAGEGVTDDPLFDASDFTWEEAIWRADVQVSAMGGADFFFNVWPMDDYLNDKCQDVHDLQYRVCGSLSTSQCGIVVRSDRDDVCGKSNGVWACKDSEGNQSPAMETRLKVACER